MFQVGFGSRTEPQLNYTEVQVRAVQLWIGSRVDPSHRGSEPNCDKVIGLSSQTLK